MLDAAREALAYTDGRGVEALSSDSMLLRALVQCITEIGEAGNRVSAPTQEAFPSVPWRPMSGMRNRLVHAYFDVNHAVLWKTVRLELPRLIPQLEAILREERGS